MDEKKNEDASLNIRGLCTVNNITLSNMSRYLLARHPELLSQRELRLAKRHLKDCDKCREEVEKQKI